MIPLFKAVDGSFINSEMVAVVRRCKIENFWVVKFHFTNFDRDIVFDSQKKADEEIERFKNHIIENC